MIIEKDCVVSFHYRLREEIAESAVASGAVDELESSYEGDPVLYLHGHRNVITGLEETLEGKTTGDTFSATISPEKAYGIRREGSEQRIPIKHLLDVNKKKIKPGMIVTVQTEDGQRQVTVIKAGKFNVDVDNNHPFAGKTLIFDLEVIEVRAATDEEKSHGHSHGVGGHQH